MNRLKYIILYLTLALPMTDALAQTDKGDVRRGNRDFRKENYREAEIDYRKALVKDSTSLAANYNLANTLYRLGDMQQARKVLDGIGDAAASTSRSSDYNFNLGNVALAQKDYQTAVKAFAQSLITNPDDVEAKENYIYAREKLKDQQNQDDQNRNQNKDQQDQQNQDGQDNKDQQDKDQQDQNKDQQNQDQNQDQNQNQNQNQDRQEQQGQQPKITPQAAQQMLQAIQAKEKETQDKVNREKANALRSMQKEKNW